MKIIESYVFVFSGYVHTDWDVDQSKTNGAFPQDFQTDSLLPGFNNSFDCLSKIILADLLDDQ